MTPTSIVAYLALFFAVGGVVVFAALLLGWLLRPHAASPEKLEPYECGEPPVGTSFVQFDLRFYVVALVFIIFEVEVAFFFPWAAVFGKSTQLMALAAAYKSTSPAVAAGPIDTKFSELGVRGPVLSLPEKYFDDRYDGELITYESVAQDARSLALTAMIDMAVFFAVLLVGFAYVWSQGDLDWVRAIGRQGQSQISNLKSQAPNP